MSNGSKRLNIALLVLAAIFVLASPVRGIALTNNALISTTGIQASNPPASAPPEAKSQKEAAEVPDEKDQYRISGVTVWLSRQLKLSPRTTAFLLEIVNFLVLFGAIAWFLRGKLPGFFQSRSERLQKQLVEARAATEDAANRLRAIEERLGKLDDEIIGMRQSAERDLNRQEERFRDMLEGEKDRIISSAEQEISSAGDAARRDLKLFAADLAVRSAEQRLKMTPELDQSLMDEFLESLEGKQ